MAEQQASERRPSGPQGKRESLGQRIKDTPRWVWIALALAAGTLIVTYLIYKQRQSGGGSGSAPVDTSGGTVPPTTGPGTTAGVDLSGLQSAITQLGQQDAANTQQLLAALQAQGALGSSPTYGGGPNTGDGTKTGGQQTVDYSALIPQPSQATSGSDNPYATFGNATADFTRAIPGYNAPAIPSPTQQAPTNRGQPGGRPALTTPRVFIALRNIIPSATRGRMGYQ